jgi:hypothetical protein
LEGAKLRRQQALLSLKQIETQIINAVQSALQKIRSARDSIESNQKVVAFNQNLLTESNRAAQCRAHREPQGARNGSALFESRNAVIDSQVAYERARLELELIQGATLTARNVDFSQRELQDRTALLLIQRKRSDSDFQTFMQALYATPPATTTVQESEDMRRARRILREKLDELERNKVSADTNNVPTLRSPEGTPRPQTLREGSGESKTQAPVPAENAAPPASDDDLEKRGRSCVRSWTGFNQRRRKVNDTMTTHRFSTGRAGCPQPPRTSWTYRLARGAVRTPRPTCNLDVQYSLLEILCPLLWRVRVRLRLRLRAERRWHCCCVWLFH